MSDYDPNSLQAVLSRLETKLDTSIAKQAEQDRQIQRIWASLSKLNLRVIAIAATSGGGATWMLEHLLK